MLKKNKKPFIVNPEFTCENGNKLRWVENVSKGWRFVGFADEIIRLDHTGWFTDEFGDETFQGIVYQLPARKGLQYFAVGYADPNNDDCAALQIVSGIDKDDAAMKADGIAKQCAETEREYNAAWQLGNEYQNLSDEIANTRKTRRELVAEVRKVKAIFSIDDTPALCAELSKRLKTARLEIMQAYNRQKEIINDHYFRGNLLDAFADGAGLSIDDAKTLTR